MKNIFSIYLRDLKKIVTNWVAVIVVMGLIILPSLYAWFNIKSSWDPYGNTKGIKVAIVNDDEGTTFNDKTLNVGDELVEELKKNKDIGWKFVSKEKAEKGVELGDYFASVEVPKNFSEDLISVTSDKIINPKLIYTVNESANAIAPKITDKGVNTIKDKLDTTVAETINSTVLKILNNAGIKYEENRDKIRNAIDKIYEADKKMPEVESLINKAYEGTITIDEMIVKINKLMPKLESTLKDTEEALNKGKNFINKANESFNSIAPIIKEDISFSKDLLDGSSEILNNVSESYDKETLLKILNRLKSKLVTVDNELNSTINMLESLNKIANSEVLNEKIQKLKFIEGKVSSIINDIDKNIDLLNNNILLQEGTIIKIKDKIDSLSGNLSEILGSYDSSIVPSINKSLDKVLGISKNAIELINGAEDALPNVNKVLALLSKGTKLTNEELVKIKKDFPEFKKSFNRVVNDIKKIDNKGNIDEVLDMIIGDWKQEGTFLAGPVKIETNRLFPVPNYGSAMSPFYTTLAIWVGGLILVSILTVNAKPLKDGIVPSPMEVFFGKYLTFLTIGILQGAMVTLGDIFILKTYVTHKVLFVLFGMFISFIFITIIYSTVSVFGNIGKAICIIFLVLQVAASGGTFPVEVMSGFFKGINPFLPFKYGIEGMRGLVGGIVPELIQRDIKILIITALVFLIMGVLFKKVMNKASKGFIDKLKESEIVEH